MIKHHGKKVSPKQWALNKLALDIDILTGYCHERYSDEYDAMTERERLECSVELDLMNNQIMKLITSALKRDND